MKNILIFILCAIIAFAIGYAFVAFAGGENAEIKSPLVHTVRVKLGTNKLTDEEVWYAHNVLNKTTWVEDIFLDIISKLTKT